jgi:class 3 adenylate cyclase
VQRLVADPAGVHLGGAQQTITVLSADLRGYTGLAERLPLEQLLAILNGHLAVAFHAVLAFGGTIGQLAGDQILALFNAPATQPDHARRAIQAAIRIRQETASYHASIPAQVRMEYGMGIATGDAIVGNMGAQEMLSYTAIGDTVNVAVLLQELAREREILLLETTRQALIAQAPAQDSPSVPDATRGIPEGHRLSDRGVTWVRGRREPVHVHALEDAGDPTGRSSIPMLQEAER